MGITIIPTSEFIRALKLISKKHRSILSDIAQLSVQLRENPTMGTDLGHNIYKIRLGISGTNKGKSGGARVITYYVDSDETVFLIEIYLKTEHDTVDVARLIQRLKDEGLI